MRGGGGLADKKKAALRPPFRTSPAFVKWLVTPVNEASQLSGHIGRLAGIAVAEPQLRDAIETHVLALRLVPESALRESAGP